MHKGKGNRTKIRILDAADRLIKEKGYASTSINDIVVNSYLTKGGFFYYFKTKDDVSLVLVDKYISRVDKLLDRLIIQANGASDDPLKQLLRFLAEFSSVFKNIPGEEFRIVSIILESIYQKNDLSKKIKEKLKGPANRIRSYILRSLLEIETYHRCDSVIDHNAFADMFISIVNGSINLSMVTDRYTLAAQIDNYRECTKALYNPATVLAAAY